jgi:hypothetical protein
MDEQMREKFEAWFTSKYGSAQLTRGPSGEYTWNSSHDHWKTWQAASTHAADEAMAALKTLVQVWPNTDKEPGWCARWGDALKQARELIVKATP